MFTKGNGRFLNFVIAKIGLLNPPTVHWWIWRHLVRKCSSKLKIQCAYSLFFCRWGMVGMAKLMVTTLANLVGQIHQKNLEVRDQIKGNYGQIYSQIHQKKLGVGQTQLFLPMPKFRQRPFTKIPPLPKSLGRPIPQTSRSEG